MNLEDVPIQNRLILINNELERVNTPYLHINCSMNNIHRTLSCWSGILAGYLVGLHGAGR